MATEIITKLEKGSVISWNDRPLEIVGDPVFIDGGFVELSGRYQNGKKEKTTFMEADTCRFDVWEG
jgi:hypothetical protein